MKLAFHFKLLTLMMGAATTVSGMLTAQNESHGEEASEGIWRWGQVALWKGHLGARDNARRHRPHRPWLVVPSKRLSSGMLHGVRKAWLNCSRNEKRAVTENGGGVNSTKSYCKNFGKCHNVPPAQQ
jgi:hypothetical protein